MADHTPQDGRRQAVVFCVLDGWGWREETAHNAVALGRTPNFDRLWAAGPRCLLRAGEEDVGLPRGQMGNSEVGHMNLGAGRVVLQDLMKITTALEAGELTGNPAFQAHIAALRASGGRCHLMGLLSPGGVHAHQDHMAQLARTVADAGIPVIVHAFTDGRDTPPTAASAYLKDFLGKLEGRPDISPGTVIGRYYAMDRDKRWPRVRTAYEALVAGTGNRADSPAAALAAARAAGLGDEFVPATIIGSYGGMGNGDGLLCANFRADRVREILGALLDPDFDGFERQPPQLAHACGMVPYSDTLVPLMSALFPPKDLRHVIGEVVAAAGLAQLRMAETEKYPHVTFFFNGGREAALAGEDRIMVPSPKVATYDLQPEMSAPELGRRLCAAVRQGGHDLIVVNFANPDMVGHTGDLAAAIAAVEAVDACLGDLEVAVRERNGVLLFTADHGNCELMWDEQAGEPHTAHTLNPVPAVLVGGPRPASLRDGRLADVAPTLLDLLGLPQPEAMTGRTLLEDQGAVQAAE